jgi:alcohol dehydrogenase class IV
MEYNLVAAPERYAKVAEALGCEPVANSLKMAKSGVAKVRELIKACGIPATLREVGVA